MVSLLARAGDTLAGVPVPEFHSCHASMRTSAWHASWGSQWHRSTRPLKIECFAAPCRIVPTFTAFKSRPRASTKCAKCLQASLRHLSPALPHLASCGGRRPHARIAVAGKPFAEAYRTGIASSGEYLFIFAAMVLPVGDIVASAAPSVEQPGAFAGLPVEQLGCHGEAFGAARDAVAGMGDEPRAIRGSGIGHSPHPCPRAPPTTQPCSQPPDNGPRAQAKPCQKSASAAVSTLILHQMRL